MLTARWKRMSLGDRLGCRSFLLWLTGSIVGLVVGVTVGAVVAPAWILAIAPTAKVVVGLGAGVASLMRPVRPYPERPCRACGFDLRATGVRCPECGRPFDGRGAAP